MFGPVKQTSRRQASLPHLKSSIIAGSVSHRKSERLHFPNHDDYSLFAGVGRRFYIDQSYVKYRQVMQRHEAQIVNPEGPQPGKLPGQVIRFLQNKLLAQNPHSGKVSWQVQAEKSDQYFVRKLQGIPHQSFILGQKSIIKQPSPYRPRDYNPITHNTQALSARKLEKESSDRISPQKIIASKEANKQIPTRGNNRSDVLNQNFNPII